MSENDGTESSLDEQHKIKLKDYVPLLLIASLVVGLDQWTKLWVRTNIPPTDSWQPQWLMELGWPARIVHWYNTGAAFGIFQDGNTFFIGVAFIVVGAILYYFSRAPSSDRFLHLAMALYLGGVIGNLIDRLTLGRVTDFISIGTFAVFNVADSSLNVAVALLLIGFLLKERREQRKVNDPS